MTHYKHNTNAILPPAPHGTEARHRYIDGREARQWFSSGGFFGDWKAGTTGMTQADLVKACAITIDVDAYDWEGAAERWGATRDERKAAMRAATEDEVLEWMKEVHFSDVVMECCDEVGLPVEANRTIYTGHGLCLVYWLGSDIGWAAPEKNVWTAVAIKQQIKRFMGHNPDLWWWDSSAKDIGTRLFPIPGGEHRDTGKKVRLVRYTDEQYDMLGWLDDLRAKYPGNANPKKKVKTGGKKAKKASTGGAPQNWSTVVHKPSEHPCLEIGESADACPLCDGSGYKRLSEKHYSCFSCATQFRIVPTINLNFSGFTAAQVKAAPVEPEPAPADPPGFIRVDPNGHALWPPQTPSRLVNLARTGVGKTHLMEREKKAWCGPGMFHKRVIAIAPTIALAGNLAARLGIKHGEAQTDIDWRAGSFAACFASLISKTFGLSGPNLKATYLMIDECESTLSQLVGLLSDGDKARETYNVLIHLAARCGKVMLADAHAGPVTLKFIEDVKKMQEGHARLEVIEWEGWYTDDHKFDFEYVSSVTRMNKKGEEVTVRSSDFMHRGRLIADIEAGKKVAVYIPGRAAAMGFAATIRQRHPNLNVQVRVRNLSNDNKNDLSQTGLTADVLVYNNAMNTGVSYDVKDHYDAVHLLLGRGNVSDSIHVEQALHRIRHPKSKTYVISGTIGDVINDWRTSAAEQVKHAIKRMTAGNHAATSMAKGVTLMGDWTFEDSSKRLAALQATIVASRYARGFRWAITYLMAKHTFVNVSGADNADFVTETRDARDALELAEARAIAQAVPADEATVAKVERQGADDEAEYHAVRAAKMEQVYGDGYAAAPVTDKAEIVHDTKKKRLAQKTRVFALSRLMDTPERKKMAVEAEQRHNARQTVMTAKVNLPYAVVLDDVFHCIATKVPLMSGRWVIDKDAARACITNARDSMKKAGMKVRDDAALAPHRQLQTLLGLGGLKMRSVKKGPRGARYREYFLTQPDVERMVRLSDAFIQRWEDHGKMPDIDLEVA